MFDRRKFLGASAAGLTLAGLGVPARAAVPMTAGREYIALGQPLTVESGAKVEVLEFFWYGCPHCFDLEPILGRWLKSAPADVQFRRVPAIFRDSWVPGAKMYYALEASGQLDKLHGPAFDAIHVEKLKLDDEKKFLEWVGKKGGDAKKVSEALSSFTVQSKVKRAEQLTRQSRIEGVPALIVDGRYLANGQAVGTFEGMLAVVDQLIVKVRAERGKK